MTQTLNILTIDDDLGSRILMKSTFEHSDLNYNLDFSNSVKEGIESIKNLPEENLPDIIILDLSMPKEDGWVFMDQYKQLDLKKRSDVFILTTSTNINDKVKAGEYPDLLAFYNKPMTITKSHEIFNLYCKKQRLKTENIEKIQI